MKLFLYCFNILESISLGFTPTTINTMVECYPFKVQIFHNELRIVLT